MRYLAFVLTVIFLIWFAHRLFNVRPAPKSQTEPQVRGRFMRAIR
jgi:hypothetical protein